jgi:uncharacterized protein YdbL (DUF1318 family)
MKKIIVIVSALMMSVAAMAMDLDDAKNMGLIGEQPNGYLGLVSVSNAEAAAVMIDIKQNTQLINIERIAGEKLVNKAQREGEFYMDGTGQWQR